MGPFWFIEIFLLILRINIKIWLIRYIFIFICFRQGNPYAFRLWEELHVKTYKAKNMGKHVCLVSPAYTSKIDSISGIREGERRGCRFYAKSGLVYDADLNAAINIARRSKHPISQGNMLDGQGVVKSPIACKSLSLARA